MTSDPFLEADIVFLPWARSRGLEVDRVWKDMIVRSIWVPDIPNRELSGQIAQLWLERWTQHPDRADVIEVHVAVGTWHYQVDASLATLERVLDEQFELLRSRGHPVA